MNIGLLGCGVVGSEVLRIIDSLSLNSHHSIKIVKVLDLKEKNDSRFTTNFDDILNDQRIDTIVEVIGGIHPAYEFICASLKAGKNVVSANKAVIARYFKEFNDLAIKNKVAFRIEASVAGGIPWIRELQRVLRMDTIHEFSGIFNGTTNYILDMMHTHDLSFEIALKEAQMKGYAESDPTSDIEGYDIQNKCAISASIAYKGYLNVDDIPIYGISSIKNQDIQYFKTKGYSCKLLGKSIHYGDSVALYVFPTCTKNIESAIDSNLNITTCKTNHLGILRMIGQGAGGSPTASAIVSDLIDITQQTQYFELNHPLIIDNSRELMHFYVRERIEDFHEEICLSYEKDDTYIYMKTKRMTISELLNIIQKKDCFCAILEEAI